MTHMIARFRGLKGNFPFSCLIWWTRKHGNKTTQYVNNKIIFPKYLFWQVSHALEGKTISSLHLLVAYVPTSPVNQSESSQIKRRCDIIGKTFWQPNLQIQAKMLGGNALRLAYRPQFAVQVYYNLVCHHTLLSGSIAPSYSKKNIRKYAVNMQTCETFARQVGQLHTTKTCFAPPSFLFMFAKPLARSTYTAHAHRVPETKLCSGWQLQSQERRSGDFGVVFPQKQKPNWGPQWGG